MSYSQGNTDLCLGCAKFLVFLGSIILALVLPRVIEAKPSGLFHLTTLQWTLLQASGYLQGLARWFT